MEQSIALGGALRPCAEPGKVSGRPGGVPSGGGLRRGLFAVLEAARVYSAPHILSAECLPAGNAPLPGTGHLQGQGVSCS
ncbi:MAG: hypothetical protein LBP61_01060 [Desulfovibrio sp.]|jgi:hypothetical protein|nr:hypothetical protein [Desulfovibrio sp.]